MKKQIPVMLSLIALYSGNNKSIATENCGGFTIGVQGGYNMLNSVNRRSAVLAPLVDRSNIGGQGILAGALIEMNHFIQNSFLIGLQVNALYTNAKGKTKTNILPPYNLETSLKVKSSYGAALRMGKTFDKFLPYIKLGLTTSKWASTTNALPHWGKESKIKNRLGFEGGIGADYQLNKTVSFSTEFSHIEYQKLNYDVFNYAGNKMYHISIKPRENRLMFQLKFKLNS